MPKNGKKKVVKVDGRNQDFLPEKIFTSIWMAAESVGGTDKDRAHTLKTEVVELLDTKYPNGEHVQTTEIGEFVEKVLIENGHAQTAKAYIRHRENKKHLRKDKDSLGVEDDIGLSYNTLYILKRRFLRRNEKGEITETPKKMYRRVAKFLASV